MIEDTVDLKTRDGAMETFICHPEREAAPLVLFLMDATGVRDELYDMARRLASVGYCVLLPNLYYRAGEDTKFSSDVLVHGSVQHTRMRALRAGMTIPHVTDDVAAILAFADTQAFIKKGPAGVHGYCMSGPYALAAAARFPDRFAAAASFYGTGLIGDTEASPHATFGKGEAEVYVACAEFDDLTPLPMVAELRGLLEKSGAPGELELYPGVHYGFAFPARKVYDQPAAERHWERLISLYRRRL